MTHSVACARPEMTVREVEKLLAEKRVTGAPVVDDAGRPVGVVSQHDLIVHQAARATAGSSGRFYTDIDDYRDIAAVPVDRSAAPVESVMSRDLVTISRGASVTEAARAMRGRRVHRLLVTDRGVLVGVVTSLDLLEALE